MNEIKPLRWLFAIAAIIVLLNIANELTGRLSWQINRLVNVDEESNLPTWFSGMLLAIASFFAYKCSLAANRVAGERFMWRLASFGFLAMSFDEVAMIHENVGLVLRKHFHITWNWSATIGPFILVLIIIFALNMIRYLKDSKKAFLLLAIGVVVYVGGAFLLEATNDLIDYDSLKYLFRTESILEESFEMFGVIIIIKGLIEHRKFLAKRTSWA